MFGIEIAGLNLGYGDRYFNIELDSFSWNSETFEFDWQSYYLQPCTKDHWSEFPQLDKDLQRVGMSNWLCPPKNTLFNIQGKLTSKFSQTLSVRVSYCTDQFEPLRPCASQNQTQQLFKYWGQGLYFTIYFTNPLIYPTSENYLTYYLEDNNYIKFTRQFGSTGILFMQEYSITTDESIIPFKQKHEQKGGIITKFAQKSFYKVQYGYYCQFTFAKSGVSHVYERSFQKLDEILSYIGGLFGTIAMCLFIVNTYNSNSYEINLGSYLFKIKQKVQSNVLKKYNFFGFLIQSFYGILSNFGIQPDWKATKIYKKCQQEMVKQLDILYLLKRISFLQRTMNFIFENHQLIGLRLQQKLTLQEAKQIRKNFRTKRKLMKSVQAHKQKLKKQSNITLTQESLDAVNINGKIYDSFIIDPPIQGKIDKHKNSTNSNFMFDSIIEKDKQKDNLDNMTLLKTENIQISSSESESDEEQVQQENNNIGLQMMKLWKQNERGKVLSQKIWQKIDPGVKNQFEIIWNKQTMEQNNQDYKKDQFSPSPYAHRFKRRSLRPISINDSPTKGSSTMQLRIQEIDRSQQKMIFER